MSCAVLRIVMRLRKEENTQRAIAIKRILRKVTPIFARPVSGMLAAALR